MKLHLLLIFFPDLVSFFVIAALAVWALSSRASSDGPGMLSLYSGFFFTFPEKMLTYASLLFEPLCDGVACCMVPLSSVLWWMLPFTWEYTSLLFCGFLSTSFGKYPLPLGSLLVTISPTWAWIRTPHHLCVAPILYHYHHPHHNAYKVLIS